MSTALKLTQRLDVLTDQERQAARLFVDKVWQRFGHHLISIVLFGSRARGEAAVDSDKVRQEAADA